MFTKTEHSQVPLLNRRAPFIEVIVVSKEGVTKLLKGLNPSKALGPDELHPRVLKDKLPTMYWLPKLHKRPYKARFIANSSSCTTTELSKLLTSCLTAIKSHVIRYCETVYETSNKNWFWSIKNSGELLNKLKCRGFRATSLSTYDFSTLYTTLPHNLIKEKLLDLIEWTFKRALKTMVHFIWHVMTERLFSLPLTKVGIHFGHARMCATPYPISWIIFILDLGPSYTDK